MVKMKISVVCHGNIARSQVLHCYLEKDLAELGVDAELFSCGVAAAEAYANGAELLQDVQQELRKRGYNRCVKRNSWDENAARTIEASDLVLVADQSCKDSILERTEVEPSKVHLFYEYACNGGKDFVDTFDAGAGKQDPDRFSRCFTELQLISRQIADRLKSASGELG